MGKPGQNLADDGKPVDAVLVPKSFGGGLEALSLYWRTARLSQAFARMLGIAPGKLFHTREVAKGHILCTAAAEATVLFPVTHPLAKQPRYDWRERPQKDGVLYGTLKEDPYADLVRSVQAEGAPHFARPAGPESVPVLPWDGVKPADGGLAGDGPQETGESEGPNETKSDAK